MILGTLLALQPPLSLVTPVFVSFAAAGSATVNASSLNVRSGPGTNHAQAAKLARGTAVTVLSETTGSDGKLWYHIRYNSGSGETTGYVLSTYIKFPVSYQPDADFEAYLNAQGFPESYKNGLRELHARYPSWVFQAHHTGLDWNEVIENQSLVGRNLVAKTSISSWKSIADGAFDWGNNSWPGFDGASWVAASDEIIRYYMDPRNFLDSVYAYQFLSHTYDSANHTSEGLALMVEGTFLNNSFNSSGASGTGNTGSSTGTAEGYGPGYQSGIKNSDSSSGESSSGSEAPSSGAETSGGEEVRFEGPSASIINNDIALAASNYGPGMVTDISPGAAETPSAASTGTVSYVDVLIQAAQQSGVNPYVLAAMIIQEQGQNGTSDSISGNSAGYPGYYNFYNIGAYQSGSNSAVTQGLVFASQSGSYMRPWNTREKSIIGGAIYYGENYVQAGQDTFYLKKFNVQGNNIYKHQYMTNVQAAASEAALYAEAHTEALKQTPLVFKIPVYQNMPEQACLKPTLDGSPNNKLSGLSVEGFTLTPTFNRDVNTYDLIVDNSVTSVTVGANAIDSTAVVSGAGNIQLQDGTNHIRITVTAGNGTTREYVLNVIRQAGGAAYSGGNAGQTGTSGGNTGVSGGPGVIVEPIDSPQDNTGTSGSGGVTVISPAG